MNRHVLSVLVQNHAGVLSRISGLFSRRMYNIDSLSVGVTENPDISRMTVVTTTDDDTVEQIKSQLSKLEEVIEVTELSKESAVLREHVLIKVSSGDIPGAMQICDIFRAGVVDITPEYMTTELTGAPSKISAFISMMEQFGVKDLVRTGMTGLARG